MILYAGASGLTGATGITGQTGLMGITGALFLKLSSCVHPLEQALHMSRDGER